MTGSTNLTSDRAALVTVRARPFNAETPPAALREPVTPADAHYVRSNFDLPEHDGSVHVTGEVERPLTLALDDLRALPASTLRVTLECAGNGRAGMAPLPTGEPWLGTAVATAEWTGARLADVLARVEPTPEGIEVAFAGADHGPYKGGPDTTFERSLPLALAGDPGNDILLAYTMNGEPLTPDHGAPVRLVVPGWYGMASVKWLSTIEVLTGQFEGQFQTRSYVYEWLDGEREAVTTERVRAIITDPAPGDVLAPGRHEVRGWAWSGTGPVTAVEVSIDGAGEWRPVDVEPPTEPYAWQAWSFAWDVAEPARHVLRARATDAAGATQPDIPPWNRLGYGNNAVQVVVVDVK
ncbi:MAG: sulfite oxidase [Chloroflexia bacterium]|nr:sulfite oxidase [Chloroflexia bacterium]